MDRNAHCGVNTDDDKKLIRLQIGKVRSSNPWALVAHLHGRVVSPRRLKYAVRWFLKVIHSLAGSSIASL